MQRSAKFPIEDSVGQTQRDVCEDSSTTHTDTRGRLKGMETTFFILFLLNFEYPGKVRDGRKS